MPELVIRDARPADREAIREVTLAAYQEYADRMSELWTRYRQNILTTLADVTPAEQLVAERDRAVVGTVLLYPARGDADRVTAAWHAHWPEVRLLAVLPTARGLGVGRALMEECARRAHRSGAGALALHTTDLMQAAIRLYEGMGFARAPELDFTPAPGFTVKGYRLDVSACPPTGAEHRVHPRPPA